MKNQQPNYFLFLCLAVSLIVVYYIFRPFLASLVLASIFAFIFQPVFRKLLTITKNRESLSALITTFIAIIIAIVPMAILGTLVLKELTELYQTLIKGENGGLISTIRLAAENLRNILPVNFDLDINQYAKQGLESLILNLGDIFSSFAKILINTLVFLISFFFLLKDGGRLKNYFVILSPLDDKDDEMIVKRLESAVLATVKGSLTIGLIQGALSGIGFALFGVPNPALWGSTAAIAALIPGVGTSLILVPAIFYLLLTGHTLAGLGLLAWGLTAVGLIDNLLGPKLIGRGMHLHPLIVFLAVLGGLSFFGPLGFLLGPLAISLCLALIDIYLSLKTSGRWPRKTA
ncbi:MAG TPA: AI-2E family transporter [bacterium]|nr:MAG: putative inner membrane protein [Parcubacteria group bacterium ADurb.Bin192]HPN15290.1 AI-2E family transporter [bacterium]